MNVLNIKQKRKIRNENGKYFIQHFKEKEKIIVRNETLMKINMLRCIYVDIKNIKQVFRYIKEEDEY